MGNKSPRLLLPTIGLNALRPVGLQMRRWSQVLMALRSQLLKPDRLNDGEAGAIGLGVDSQSGQDLSMRGCMAALDEMHMTLQRETAQRHELERSFHVVQRALVQAEADLICVRGGERRARHQAMHDELTALPNRRHLLVLLSQALAEHAPGSPGLALMYVDLDHFKMVNDNHGHAVGDQVLRITAARLTGAVRQCDTVVRLGGDEFVCLLQNVVDAAPLRMLCSKLVDALSAPMQIGVLQLLVRPSIGLAVCRAHGDTADSLLTLADQAMYTAKRRGSGFAFAGDLS